MLFLSCDGGCSMCVGQWMGALALPHTRARCATSNNLRSGFAVECLRVLGGGGVWMREGLTGAGVAAVVAGGDQHDLGEARGGREQNTVEQMLCLCSPGTVVPVTPG